MTAHTTTDWVWAQIPEDVLYSTMTDKAVRIYGVLVRHGLTPDSCFPSQERIATLIGCSPRSVQRPMRELEEAGWVESMPRFDADGTRLSNGYRVRTGAPPHRAPERDGARNRTRPIARQNAGGPRARTRGARAPERDERKPLNESHLTTSNGAASAQQRLIDESPVDDNDEATADAAAGAAARDVVRRAWDERTRLELPKLVVRGGNAFMALVGMARTLIDAGHDASDVERAIVNTSLPTLAAIQLELGRTRKRPRRSEALDHLDRRVEQLNRRMNDARRSQPDPQGHDRGLAAPRADT